METIRWSVAQIFSKRAGRLERAVKDQTKGIYTPMFKRVRFIKGEKSETEHRLIPGYIFFETGASLRGPDGQDLEGVIRVLNHPVDELEMFKFVVRGAAQEWNEIAPKPAASPTSPEVRRGKSRRSRPSKKARLRAAARRVAIQGEIGA